VNNLFNFILFQIGWLLCVQPAAHGNLWLGPLAALGLAGMHVACARSGARKRYAVWLVAVATLGWSMDSGLKALGVTSYPTSPGALAPVWIWSLWLLFATTAHHSLRWLQGRTLLAIALGFVGGPLAYWSGVRLGATGFAHAPAYSLGFLGLEYALVTPLVLASAKRHAAPNQVSRA